MSDINKITAGDEELSIELNAENVMISDEVDLETAVDRLQANHASETTEYGAATTEDYGHVKIDPTNGLTIDNGVLNIQQASETQSGIITSTQYVSLLNDIKTIKQWFIPEVSPLEFCTELEIINALDYHYRGVLDIENMWAVGDEFPTYKTTGTFDSTNTGSPYYLTASTACAIQDMKCRIVDFKHYKLLNTIRDIEDAAITIMPIKPLTTAGAGGNSTYSWTYYKNWISKINNILPTFYKEHCVKVSGVTPSNNIDYSSYFILTPSYIELGSTYGTKYGTTFKYFETDAKTKRATGYKCRIRGHETSSTGLNTDGSENVAVYSSSGSNNISYFAYMWPVLNL